MISAQKKLSSRKMHTPGCSMLISWHNSGPSPVRVDVNCGEEVLLSGDWEFAVQRDGRAAAPASAWEEICWFSDSDVYYLELEMALHGGLRVQRHMLLAREDHFLLLADAVLGIQPGVIEYRGILPAGNGLAFRAADETREGFLVRRKRCALVLPLALPEWRCQSGSGELTQTGAGLELTQSAAARCLFAPLLLDLDRRRMARQATWRQLSVAQSLRAQPAEVAVGYRVAIGKQQWLIYRSLAETANRTVLGHNLSSDMLVARFLRSGEVVPLVEIE